MKINLEEIEINRSGKEITMNERLKQLESHFSNLAKAVNAKVIEGEVIHKEVEVHG